MLGFRFVKFDPNYFVVRYRRGRVVASGRGLAFLYRLRTTAIAKIPTESVACPFIFEELTSDFQTVSVQGEVVYRIADPETIKDQINFAVDGRTLEYASEDPARLPQRVTNAVRVLVKRRLAGLELRAAIRASDAIVDAVRSSIGALDEVRGLGIEVLSFSILAILPNKETARALEAQTREVILKEADDALYNRRNSSVEQERRIKENELSTEIAVEQKRREIREAQMDAERAVQEKRQAIERSDLLFQTTQEEERGRLVDLAIRNGRAQADLKGYSLEVVVKALGAVDPAVISALASVGMEPAQLVALALNGIARNADRIGELNVSPELLASLARPRAQDARPQDGK